MPWAPQKRCGSPNCPTFVEQGQKYCVEHTRAKWKAEDVKRGGTDPFYYSTAWLKCRKHVLSHFPLCCVCDEPASVVDHIVPRSKGGADFLLSNLQSMCQRCHNKKRAEEKEVL